ncbi:MAG: FIG00458480: hypothetical protein [uncultured Caballeronia sp.]|nr:MAG: FIG00458480: hypothetical protein [uncultured Caballeronia sp.]
MRSTPQVKAPTKKAFHFPKGADGKVRVPAKSDGKASTKTEAKPAAASKSKAKPPAAPKTKALSSAQKNATKAAVKAPAAKNAAKATVAEAAADKTAKTQAKPEAKTKHAKKEKVVRDSFTMPKSDYAKIAALKEKCQKNGIRVKKSELLRAALVLLDSAPEKLVVETVKALETVKTGRSANA